MIPVKICGIKTIKDAETAVIYGAKAIGFIFFKKSPRFITINHAAFIANSLPKSIKKIGVFVNSRQDVINSIIKKVNLDLIQLHGNEPNEFCNFFDIPVIKAFQVKSLKDLHKIELYKNISAILLDNHDENLYGGTGKSFDWKLLDKVKFNYPIILSGGLKPSNINDAITLVNPNAVDINSGVENSPGIKSSAKIKSLFDKLLITKTTGYCFE